MWCSGGNRKPRTRSRIRRPHADCWATMLHAGNYFYTGERFVPPGAEKKQLSERAFADYHTGLKYRHPELEFLEIPYQDGPLPALFIPARGARSPAPTVIVFDGMDNCKEMSILFAGLEFAKRGFNTLSIDGPGQGESLRLRGLHARHDYEVPAAAAYDAMAARPDVDPASIFVMGYSFGGYYAARIAAREPRLKGAIALTSGHWDLAAFQRSVLEKQKLEKRKVAQSKFQFQWVVGVDDPDTALLSLRTSARKTSHTRLRCHS